MLFIVCLSLCPLLCIYCELSDLSLFLFLLMTRTHTHTYILKICWTACRTLVCTYMMMWCLCCIFFTCYCFECYEILRWLNYWSQSCYQVCHSQTRATQIVFMIVVGVVTWCTPAHTLIQQLCPLVANMVSLIQATSVMMDNGSGCASRKKKRQHVSLYCTKQQH